MQEGGPPAQLDGDTETRAELSLVEQTWASRHSWRKFPAALPQKAAVRDQWWPRRQACAGRVTSPSPWCGRVSETGSLGASSGPGEVGAVGQLPLSHSIAVVSQELPKKQAKGSEMNVYLQNGDILFYCIKLTSEEAFKGLIGGYKP